jgi:outer membrane protein assembly factor BamE (lipoprotein component of BamABCDE complex)
MIRSAPLGVNASLTIRSAKMKRLLVLIPMILLSACVYVQSTHVRNKGVEINKQQVALIEPGKTDKAWVLHNIGTPDRIEADNSGIEVYEYISERTERSEKKFFLLFSVESDKIVSRRTTRVTFHNSIVESIITNDA